MFIIIFPSLLYHTYYQFQPAGKFSVEDFEQIGTINSVPVHEYNLDTLEEKPWRKPGADITGNSSLCCVHCLICTHLSIYFSEQADQIFALFFFL